MNAKKDFLRKIVDERPIGNGAQDDSVDEVLVTVDQLTEGCVTAGPAPLDERLFGGLLHQMVRLDCRAQSFVSDG